MKLFLTYLKYRAGIIGAFFAFLGLFFVSFRLYRLPLAAAIYPAALCLLLGAILLTVDFFRVRRRHEALVRLQNMTAESIEALPTPGTIPEKDCQALIARLESEIRDIRSADQAQFRAMTDYCTVWAHQVKTPIAAMKLTLQNEDSPLARQLSSRLFQIEQYVEMVLAYLRLDSDTTDYVFRRCTLDSVIRPTLRKYASEFILRKLSLSYEPITAEVVTDEKWLAFVLEQILSNALKYTRTGTIRIYLRAPMTLCVSDTGIGIAPEDLPRIFDRGYTGCNGRTDRSASGIGLFLCKMICDKLGIGISAESTVGEGTTLFLDLSREPVRGD